MQDQRLLSAAGAAPAIRRMFLLGAGGHAAVVYDALRKSSAADWVEVRDDAPMWAGQAFFDLMVCVPALPESGLTGVPFHVAIGHNGARAKLQERAEGAGGFATRIVHPAAQTGLGAVVGAGSFLAAGCIVGPRSAIGRGCIINHGAVVDHDCVIDEWSHVAPRAVLGGGVEIGASCLIGAGALVLPGRRVGAGSTVGAGAVVTRDIAPSVTVAGVPARIM